MNLLSFELTIFSRAIPSLFTYQRIATSPLITKYNHYVEKGGTDHGETARSRNQKYNDKNIRQKRQRIRQ
jgi:uncharacterized protein YheU (UPF0270 family)